MPGGGIYKSDRSIRLPLDNLPVLIEFLLLQQNTMTTKQVGKERACLAYTASFSFITK